MCCSREAGKEKDLQVDSRKSGGACIGTHTYATLPVLASPQAGACESKRVGNAANEEVHAVARGDVREHWNPHARQVLQKLHVHHAHVSAAHASREFERDAREALWP